MTNKDITIKQKNDKQRGKEIYKIINNKGEIIETYRTISTAERDLKRLEKKYLKKLSIKRI